MVKTSTVRGTVVIGRSIPLVLVAEAPADDFGIVGLVHGDELVSEALVILLELACVEAHELEVNTLDGHDVVVLSVVGGVAIVVLALSCTDGRLEDFQVMGSGAQHEGWEMGKEEKGKSEEGKEEEEDECENDAFMISFSRVVSIQVLLCQLCSAHWLKESNQESNTQKNEYRDYVKERDA